MTNGASFNIGVQYLRGIAALAVVLCHYSMEQLPNYIALENILKYGQLGVHIFFFISGYVIVLSMQKIDYKVKLFPKFILRRSIRIDIVYISAILLTLLTFWLLSALPAFKGKIIVFNIWQFLAHLFYYVPFTKYEFYNHIFWTLGIEFQFYVLIGLFYFINQSRLFKVSFLVLFTLSSFIKANNSYYLLTTYSPFFAMGIATLNYHITREKSYLILMSLIMMLIFYTFGYISGLLILLSVITILFLKFKSQILFFFGQISYSLYIIHPLIFIYAHGVTKKLFPNLLNSEIILLLLNVMIAIGGAYLFYILIERPSVRLSKKIKVN